MTGRGRFQVSASDKRLTPTGTRLSINIPQAARFQQQQRILAEIGDDDDDRKVVLGICAMAKKSNSKPMKEIIQRLVDNFERLQVIVFDEDTILNKAVEDWPIVNGLVSFFSSGFPLEKAIAYKELRKPFVVNDLEMQHILQDRRKVYAMMKENEIPHPRYAVLDRENDPDCKVVQTEDSIEINGTLFTKPFVEKPLSAEDHNIYIYFPVAAGGGSTRLFRKIEDRSSVYLRCCRVRSSGSYLYEDFMPTDGTDVKVYTVGPDYQHAEARKSPALDGKVERDSEGKEIRYPVLLSNREKMIARNVCRVFKQNVCGFDLLRANGQHYVCDVNGFSFVKTSSKYYDDCAKILGTLVMRECCPQLHIPYPLCTAPEDIPVVQTSSGLMMELRTVIAVIRHGDRTPKQKMKMEVKNIKFFELFKKYNGYKTGHLKLKKPNQLQEVLDIVRHLLAEGTNKADHEVEEKKVKLNQLKLVLEMYGYFSGINRKVQLKYQPTGRPKKSSSDDDYMWEDNQNVFYLVEDETPREPSLLLILKWGGELTPAGRIQAENLGKAFRTLYPGGQGQFEGPGLGFLRLHSTFRHDLKIYASDEGRVQMTAAAFTKGLLALEGELTPIVVQMVKSANTNGLLDGESNQSKYQIVVKEKLKAMFNEDRDFTEADHLKLAATNNMSVINAMEFVKNPYRMCCRVHEMIKEITARIRCLKVELKSRDPALFNGESWELLIRRWGKLEKDFRLKNGHFDISKIPDIYDCIKYDLQHNQATLQFKRAQELFMCSKALADIVIPQEYGITRSERLHIAQSYCSPLLQKIRSDLLQCVNEPPDDHATRLDSKYSKGVLSPERFVRTRLYFTSESHIHSLLSMLRYGGFLDEEKDEQWKRSMDFMGACAELNYMSQIVIMMFEDPDKDENSDERFHVELHFSPGAYTSCDEMGSEPKGMGFRPKLQRESTRDSTTTANSSESQEEQQTPDAAQTFSRKPVLRQCSSVPSNVASKDLEDLVEEDLFTHAQDAATCSSSKSDSTVSKKKGFRFLPRSPDPNTPEWDWSDTEEDVHQQEGTEDGGKEDEENVNEVDNSKATSSSVQSEGFALTNAKPLQRQEERPAYQYQISLTETTASTGAGQEASSAASLSLSLPKSVELMLRGDSSDAFKKTEKEKEALPGANTKKSEPIEILSNPPTDSIRLSFDEKLSRSLEDSCSTVSSKQGLAKVERCLRKLHMLQNFIAATYQRNYKTIHLPLGNELTIKPLSSFFFYNQIPRALEGFSNVPLLHPLETLHNNLTFNQVDEFLHRLTTEKFPVPDPTALNSLAQKSALTLTSPVKGPDQFPSSSNSSGGPNSPTAGAAQTDLMRTLGIFMGSNCKSYSLETKQDVLNQSQNSVTSTDSADPPQTSGIEDQPSDLSLSQDSVGGAS